MIYNGQELTKQLVDKNLEKFVNKFKLNSLLEGAVLVVLFHDHQIRCANIMAEPLPDQLPDCIKSEQENSTRLCSMDVCPTFQNKKNKLMQALLSGNISVVRERLFKIVKDRYGIEMFTEFRKYLKSLINEENELALETHEIIIYARKAKDDENESGVEWQVGSTVGFPMRLVKKHKARLLQVLKQMVANKMYNQVISIDGFGDLRIRIRKFPDKVDMGVEAVN